MFPLPQPVLGILTLYLNDKKQLEERQIYQRMIIEGQRIGLDIFVFTPMDVNDNKKIIHGLEYNTGSKTWTRRWRKFPDLIFDRCRIQRSKRFEQLKRFRARYRDMTFLNRPLRNKWTIHQTLSQKSQFRSHLPKTELFNSINNVTSILKNHPSIYVKPINGTGGRGIIRVDKSGGGTFLIQGRKQTRKIIPPKRVNMSSLSRYLLHLERT